MKTEKPSDHLRELFQVAYVENPNKVVRTQDLNQFLNPYITMRMIKKGEDIVRPNDMLRSIIMVVKGGAHFMRVSMGGNTNMIGAANAPFFIGLTQLVSNDKEFYSHIVAAKNCVILNIDCGYFQKGIREDGEVAMVVIRDLAKTVERNHIRMDRLVFFKASTNLMAYVCHRWPEHEEDQKKLYIREQHGVIAADLGVSVRTLYRSINSLKEEGLIKVKKGGVLVVNEDQVETMKYRLQTLEICNVDM